jgi:hypothetical protein
MQKTRILTLMVCLAAFLLGGCVIARDITASMDEKSQEKFADRVACKVVEKLKKDCPCPQKACAPAAEPNKPCK